MPPKNSSICSGGNCLIAYLYVLVSPRLCQISAKKACLSFLFVQLQHPSSTPYKYRLQRLLISCLYLCSTYKFDGICNILSLRALLVDQISAFNASHRVHNKPYDHRLHKGISQSDSTESHSFETRIFIFPLFIFRPLLSIAALHVLKHPTTSFTCTGGFVNICPTPAVANDTWMESSSRQNENRKLNFLFEKCLNWILICISTCAEVLNSL